MSGINYAAPIQVNGYPCQNCGQVEEARNHVNPANPGTAPQDVARKAAPPAGTGVKLDLVV